MSVQFAQQTELARINKRACQRCTSMQTQSDEDEVEERGKEVRAPTASPSSSDWLEKVERELEDRNAEIRKLKDELQKTKSGPEQVSITLCASTSPCNVPIHCPLSSHATNVNFISENSPWLCVDFIYLF